MFTPPGIGLCQPEDIEPGLLASFRHAHGLVQGFHAELQHANLEWDILLYLIQPGLSIPI
jgi:hypothetical protein